MGQVSKKGGWKEKWMDSDYLAILSNYHLTRKNTRYLLASEMGGMETPMCPSPQADLYSHDTPPR